MNIEDSIKILKEFNKIKINSYAMQFVNISYPDLQEAIETLLTAYEKQSKEIEELKREKAIYYYEWKHLEAKVINKIEAKVIEIKNRPVKDEFITATQGKLNTIIEIESLLEKE